MAKTNKSPRKAAQPNRLNCRDSGGDGQPIVFIHGWSQQFAYWNMQYEYFKAEGYRVILYDWPGNGCARPAKPPYDFQTLIEDLGSLLVDLNLTAKPVLVGHSMGGAISLEFAIQDPGLFSALVILDSALPQREKEEKQLKQIVAGIEKYGVDALVPTFQAAFWGAAFQKDNPAAIALWQAQCDTNLAANLIYSLRAWVKRPDPVKKLNLVTVPTLLLVGAEDDYVSVKEMRKLQAGIPNSQLEIIANAGHMCYCEQPDAVNKNIATFLSGLPPA